MLTTVASRSMTWEKTSRVASPPPMAAIAPRIGMPAAMKPPNTNTMTSRLTGSAMPSPTRRSISTWWLMSLTSKGTPLVRAVAPGTVARAEEASRWIRSIAASWAALSSPASSVAVTRKPGPVDAAADRTSGAAAAELGPPGTRKGDCTDATSGVADTRCCSVLAALGRGRVARRRRRRPARAPAAPVLAPADEQVLPGARLPGHAGVAGGQPVEEGLAGDAPHRGGEREHHRDQPDAEDPSGAARDDRPQAVRRGPGWGRGASPCVVSRGIACQP